MTMSSRSIAVAATWALPRRAGLSLLKQQPLARRSLASGPHFDGFFGGGFPGQGGPAPGVDTEKFYKLLGTDKNASESEIKSAYKKQAMKHHPDRGGDEAKFKEISKAYEVLSDPQKRQIYDTYGEQGLEGADQGGGGGAPHGMDPFDLFSQMFGFQAQGGRQGRRGRPVTRDSHYELQLSLEELYTGTSRSIKFTRDAICGSCHGQGGKNPKTCQRCNGTGVVVQLQQMGPFMRQSQSPCSACDGKGQIIKPEDICKTCTGKGTVKETKTFYIEVEPGQENGTEIRFTGAADEAPGHDTGDVVIVIKEKSHKTFQRVKESLVMSKKITLVEALCGFQFTTKFLDGEDLIVRSTPGQVCRPGDMLIVKGKGMPRKNSQQTGDLFLQLKVEFPDEVPEASRGALAELLGGKLPPDDNLIESSSAKKLTQRQIDDIHQRWSHAARQQEQNSTQCTQQ